MINESVIILPQWTNILPVSILFRAVEKRSCGSGQRGVRGGVELYKLKLLILTLLTLCSQGNNFIIFLFFLFLAFPKGNNTFSLVNCNFIIIKDYI